jgi:hypothetical protein
MSFENELTCLINKHKQESKSNTPDFILADYILSVLECYNNTVSKRDDWFGINVWNVGKPKFNADKMY